MQAVRYMFVLLIYSETYLGRLLPWETNCLEGPHFLGRRSNILMQMNLSPETTVTRDHLSWETTFLWPIRQSFKTGSTVVNINKICSINYQISISHASVTGHEKEYYSGPFRKGISVQHVESTVERTDKFSAADSTKCVGFRISLSPKDTFFGQNYFDRSGAMSLLEVVDYYCLYVINHEVRCSAFKLLI